jgi:Short C-terminal domain
MLLRPFVRKGRPGLIGRMAGTTVVVGLSRRQQAKEQPAADAPADRKAAAERPAAPADLVAQLKELGALKAQGVLTEEEFAAQKARILGA